MPKPKPTTCSECGKAMVATTDDHLARLRKGQRVYCSKDCSTEYRRRVSSETMARTNRRYASERMIRNNPAKREDVREKISKTMRERGHKPSIRGGNGRPPTKAEEKLVELFGSLGFQEQYIARTGMGRGSGYPNHYKIDCGNGGLKIGIEADGGSHNSPERRGQDAKKDRFLTERGWRMFRFKNDVILGQPEYVFETVLTAIMERH